MDTFYGPLSVRIKGVWLSIPLYGHPIITDSLLCPWGKKALTIFTSLCMPSSFLKKMFLSHFTLHPSLFSFLIPRNDSFMKVIDV